MENMPEHASGPASDLRGLRCFAVAAEEGSLRRAAERLCLSQPPLSRHIKRLEDALGLTLFVRRSTGVTLTEDGRRVLEIVRPLLELQEDTGRRLAALAATAGIVRVGFTTAFEQGVFVEVEARLAAACGPRLRITRGSSPKLAREVRAGRLDAALLALPLDAPGLAVTPTGYAEPLLAVLPISWPEAGRPALPLAALSGRPLFWFPRERNPAFFDFAKRIFALARFRPRYKEEPAEHDVLLARIAAGEGMSLLPSSFAAIRREGVAFVALEEAGLLHLALGAAVGPECPEAARRILEMPRSAP